MSRTPKNVVAQEISSYNEYTPPPQIRMHNFLSNVCAIVIETIFVFYGINERSVIAKIRMKQNNSKGVVKNKKKMILILSIVRKLVYIC